MEGYAASLELERVANCRYPTAIRSGPKSIGGKKELEQVERDESSNAV